MRLCSIADFVDDVASVANSLPQPPVVIGHSLGGFVVQKYLESHDAPAAVLVASIPPSGITRFLLRCIKRHPWRTGAQPGDDASHCAVLPVRPKWRREIFFSALASEADVAALHRAALRGVCGKIALDLLRLNLPRPNLVTTPLLVLGAEDDLCFTQAEVHATAAAYRTEAEFYPKMSHDMMLDPGWVTSPNESTRGSKSPHRGCPDTSDDHVESARESVPRLAECRVQPGIPSSIPLWSPSPAGT